MIIVKTCYNEITFSNPEVLVEVLKLIVGFFRDAVIGIIKNIGFSLFSSFASKNPKRKLIFLGKLVIRCQPSRVIYFVKTTLTIGGKSGIFVTNYCINIAFSSTRNIISLKTESRGKIPFFPNGIVSDICSITLDVFLIFIPFYRGGT